MKQLLTKLKICAAIITGKRFIISIDYERKTEYVTYISGATIWQCMKTASELQSYSYSKITEQ